MNWVITSAVALGAGVVGYIWGESDGEDNLRYDILISHADDVEEYEKVTNYTRSDRRNINLKTKKNSKRNQEVYDAMIDIRERQADLEKVVNFKEKKAQKAKAGKKVKAA